MVQQPLGVGQLFWVWGSEDPGAGLLFLRPLLYAPLNYSLDYGKISEHFYPFQFDTMSQLVEAPNRSVLCIGHIDEERHTKMITHKSLLTLYLEKIRFLNRYLASEGCDTFIHTSCGRFEIISAGELQRMKPELIKDFGNRFVHSMAVFEDSRTFITMPPHSNYFDEVLRPQQDDPDLTADDVIDNVLSNVSMVLFDNDDCNPFIQSALEKALLLKKRMININSSTP